MKKIAIAASALLGLILAGPVFAQTTEITFTGSTALRSPIQQGIQNLLTNARFEGNNADFKRANFGIWTGSFNGKNVRIKLAWSGSNAGISNTASSTPIKFPANNTPTVDPNADGAESDTRVPDITIGDTFQSTTGFLGIVSGRNFVRMTDNLLAVQIFQWLGSKGFPANGVTSYQVQQIFLQGNAPLAMITGENADRNKTVFALGRNPGSGTRSVALADSFIGATTTIRQWQPTITNTRLNSAGAVVGGNITSHVLWPIELVDGVSTRFLGNSGFSSGSSVASALTANMRSRAFRVGNANATAGYYLSYLGLSDAPTALAEGAVALRWNGVEFTNRAVREGTYSFWSYGHLFYRPTLSGDQLAFATALINQVKAVEVRTISTLVGLDQMGVRRAGDGGRIIPRYF